MENNNRDSLQDIWQRRQPQSFVGRQDELSFFEKNLLRDARDPRKIYILNVYGITGIGKTSLLNRFHIIAEENGVISAWIDRRHSNVVTVMSEILAQLGSRRKAKNSFFSLYANYKEIIRKIANDPALHDKLSHFIELEEVHRLGERFNSLEYSSSVISPHIEIDENLVNELRQMGISQNELQLLVNPVRILTPTFVRDLYWLGQRKQIALFIDDYDQSSGYFDTWFLKVITGEFGDFTVNAITTIAGRSPLGNHWNIYSSILTRIHLQGLSFEDVRSILQNQGVPSHGNDVKNIFQFSGGTPLLVHMSIPLKDNFTDEIVIPAPPIIERTLSEVENPEYRQIVLDAVLPRFFNREILNKIANYEKKNISFQFISNLSFINRIGDRFIYHQTLRPFFVSYLRDYLSIDWYKIHFLLANYYNEKLLGFSLERDRSTGNNTWWALRLEYIYHKLCLSIGDGLPIVVEQLIYALEGRFSRLRQLSEMILDAGQDTDSPLVKKWGENLTNAARWLEAEKYEQFIPVFAQIIEQPSIPKQIRAIILAYQLAFKATLGHTILSSSQLEDTLEALEDNRRHEYMGLVYLYARRLTEAEMSLTQSLKFDPHNSRVNALLGETLRFAGRYDEALLHYNRALELDESNTWLLGRRAEAYSLMGRNDEAIDEFQLILRIDPLDFWAMARCGRVYYEIKSWANAIKYFDQVIKDNKDLEWVYELNGLAKYEAGHFRDAIGDLRIALENSPTNFAVVSKLAESFRRIGYNSEAIKTFNIALRLKPNDTWVLLRRGETYRTENDFSSALADFNQALEENPNHVWGIAQRGEVYRQIGRLNVAIKDFNRALRLQPDYGFALARRGESYRTLSKFENALEDFNRALEIDPNDQWLLAKRGELYQQIGRYDRAVADFDQVIRGSYRNFSALVGRGTAYLGLGQLDKAIEDFNKVLNSTRSSEALLGRAEVYVQMVRYEDALIDIAIILKESEENEKALTVQGEIYLHLERYEEALVVIEKALKVSPHNKRAVTCRGNIYQKLGKHSKALSDYNTVIDENTPDSKLLIKRGEILLGLGKHREALGDFEKALQLDPDNPLTIALRGVTIAYTQTESFLLKAGFSMELLHPRGIIGRSGLPLWGDFSPIYVHLVLERPFDFDELQQLRLSAQSAYNGNLRNHISIAVINHPPRTSDLFQIFALRASDGFSIIPLPRSLIDQGLIDKREKEVLKEHIDLYTGKSDLYDIRTAVSDFLSFFGRETFLADIGKKLTSGQSLILYGIRKMGKSSVANRLREELAWPVALVDLEGYTNSLSYIFEETLISWKATISTRFPNINVTAWHTELHEKDFSTQVQFMRQSVMDILNQLIETDENTGLLLFLDEFDLLIKQDNYNDFCALFRNVSENAKYKGRFAILGIGLDPYINRVDRVNNSRNPFFSFFGEVPLKTLSPEDTSLMITSIGAQMGINYEQDALTKLVETGGGHPFLTRQLCSTSIGSSSDINTVQLSQVENAIENYLSQARNYLSESLWDLDYKGPAPEIAYILKFLALNGAVPEKTILQERPKTIKQRDLALGIQHLHDQGLIKKENSLWVISIPLYTEWIRRNLLDS